MSPESLKQLYVYLSMFSLISFSLTWKSRTFCQNLAILNDRRFVGRSSVERRMPVILTNCVDKDFPIEQCPGPNSSTLNRLNQCKPIPQVRKFEAGNPSKLHNFTFMSILDLIIW